MGAHTVNRQGIKRLKSFSLARETRKLGKNYL